MNTDDLKALLKNKQIIDFDSSEQDFEHRLRLVLRDIKSGQLGLLAVEPAVLIMPDETLLDYSYQVLTEPRMPHFDECDYNFTAEPPIVRTGLFE